MSQSGQLESFLEDRELNAALAWILVGFVALVAVESALDRDWVWVGVTLVITALAVVPPLAYRNPRVMLPWEVLALAVVPDLARALLYTPFVVDLATYLSVAALALVVAVELDVFTAVRMTEWFAVLFVVLSTLATAGVLAVGQWLSDVFFGTHFLYTESPEIPAQVANGGAADTLLWLSDVFVGTTFTGPTALSVPPAVEQAALDALMWDFVAATVVGILAGVVFERYFRRRANAHLRLPEGVEETLDIEEAGE
ncbi:hypothetical protein GCM10009019_03280 [Salarchaeum japonicum]|uniref:Uncharacterized protein n=1 Tax=Salarchaeum japonicum TaxID=555573 RepID=A0AAV3SXK7_9EURY|nr:hypothetical protein [Salarchaeum japonicum]